jgi:AAA+ ATPase superfamily predicted ATPase
MYFEEQPKSDLKDLYNYREELNLLIQAVKRGDRLIVIEGRRRTGKTSLLLTALTQIEQPNIVVDARQFSTRVTIARRDFIEALEAGLNRLFATKRGWVERLATAVKKVGGVEVEMSVPPRLSLSWGGIRKEAVNLVSLFSTLGEAAVSHETSLVIALDEAQEFKRLAGFNLAALIAHTYDYVRGVQWVVTGSQVGVLHDFLGFDNARAPLFGRVLTRIPLKGLSKEDSKSFLKQGFEQIGLRPDDQMLLRVVERLDGTVGWLTYVGVVSKRRQRLDEAVLEDALMMGSKLAASEFEDYLSIRPQARRRYVEIIKAVAETPRGWSEIKRAVENVEGRGISDYVFNQLLSNLEKANFIEKMPGGLYAMVDPLLARAARGGLLGGASARVVFAHGAVEGDM